MKKALKTAVLMFFALLLLTGCGHVKSPKQLVKKAQREHGDCDIVSIDQQQSSTSVVLRDRLQGFEYTISSGMHDINLDGTSFGSVENTNDDFMQSLEKYVLGSAQNSLKEICDDYNADYEDCIINEMILELKLPPDITEADIADITERTATLIQSFNQNNRLDGVKIYVSYNNEWLKQYCEQLKTKGEYKGLSSVEAGMVTHIGSARLPDTSFRDKEKETEDYYLEMAQMKEPSAVFVKKEVKTFADTGMNLNEVMSSLGDENTVENYSDPVTFYYFKAGKRSFYICDVLDKNTQTWHTDYPQK